MLEWYRADYSLSDLMDETAKLMTSVLGKKEIVKKTYAKIFSESTGVNPLSATIEKVEACCSEKGRNTPRFSTLTDALQFAMAEIVEPRLPPDSLVFVHHYPADQAVLAVLEPEDARTARRFEAYCGGMELVNGFEELAEQAENLRRQELENEKRRAAGKPALEIDRLFIDALKSGLPACSGAALGIHRLIMLALEKTSIDDVLSFTWENS